MIGRLRRLGRGSLMIASLVACVVLFVAVRSRQPAHDSHPPLRSIDAGPKAASPLAAGGTGARLPGRTATQAGLASTEHEPGFSARTKEEDRSTSVSYQLYQHWIKLILQEQDAAQSREELERVIDALSSDSLDDVCAALCVIGDLEGKSYDRSRAKGRVTELLRSPDADVRYFAARALPAIDRMSGDVDQLVALSDDPSEQIRECLPAVLRLYAPERVDGLLVGAFRRLLSDKNPKIVQAALAQLASASLSPEIEDCVVEIARDPVNRDSAISAILAISAPTRARSERLVSVLLETICEPSSDVAWADAQLAAVKALRSGVPGTMIPTVVSVMQRILSETRLSYLHSAAIEVLGGFGGEEAVRILRTFAASTAADGPVREQAVRLADRLEHR